MPKNVFSMPTAKNGFHILNLHPNRYIFKKYPFFKANLPQKVLIKKARVIKLILSQ